MDNTLPEKEIARLQSLTDLGILDTEPEKAFDAITKLAATICDAPISLISLIDSKRQWFKSAYGIGVTETPRDIAFCAHAIKGNDIMEVSDATQDKRFVKNPLVNNDPKIRFYAGKPLVTKEGFALGTLCVIDRKPKT